MANLSCCAFAIKLFCKNTEGVESGSNYDKRNDIRRKWNISFSCFWKFRPLDRCLGSLRKEIRSQKGRMANENFDFAASGARANSPPLVERETRWNITKVFLGSPLSFLEIERGEKSWKRYRASKFFAPLKATFSCFLVSVLLKPLKLIPRFAE